MLRFLLIALPFLLVACDRDTATDNKPAEPISQDEPAVQDEPVWHSLAPQDWQALSFGGEGAAAWNEDVLHLDLGVDLTGVRYEGEIPKIPYEIELEVRKLNGNDFFCGLTFPVGSSEECLTFIVGGWGGSTVGISSIDGQDASANETTSYHNFEKDRWYAIRVRVEEGKIAADIGDEQVVDLSTAGKELGLRRGIIEICAPLGFAAWQTEVEARRMRWRSLAD